MSVSSALSDACVGRRARDASEGTCRIPHSMVEAEEVKQDKRRTRSMAVVVTRVMQDTWHICCPLPKAATEATLPTTRCSVESI